MQINTNNFTFLDDDAAKLLADSSIRPKKREAKSSRRHYPQPTRNELKERNQSAMLPRLEKNRYPSAHMKNQDDTNVLNFVQASRRQMNNVIGQQQPQARRFFDDAIKEQDQKASVNKHGLMPDFATNQLARARPSIQSVKQSNRKMGINLQHMNDEISELASSHHRNKAMQRDNELLQSRMQNLISPKGLAQNPSMASLVTESHHQSQYKTPMSIHTASQHAGKMSNSPSSNSLQATLGRELKHLCNYLDQREMQIRTEIESTSNIDVKLEQNKLLEELYQQVMGQARKKLPQATAVLSSLVKRVMDGLQECFQDQEKDFTRKIETRNKTIDSLRVELDEMKQNFYNFRKDSTMDAYFAKYPSIVDRVGRQDKDILKDLVKTVDEFLGDDETFKKTLVKDERAAANQMEPSGVDALLLQLQMHGRSQELPQIAENPLAMVDAEKPEVMKEMKKEMNLEANKVRGLIEAHVKQQMGYAKPTSDSSAQTLTFRRLEDQIMERSREQIEIKTKERMLETFNLKLERLNKEIDSLNEKNKNLREKFREIQKKQDDGSSEGILKDVTKKVNQFFRRKLRRDQQVLLKEFNESILGIVNGDDFLEESDLASQIASETASRKRRANKFEHLLADSDSRRSRISDESINKVLANTARLVKSVSSVGSFHSLNKSFEDVPQILEEAQLEDKLVSEAEEVASQSKPPIKVNKQEEESDFFNDEASESLSELSDQESKLKNKNEKRKKTAVKETIKQGDTSQRSVGSIQKEADSKQERKELNVEISPPNSPEKPPQSKQSAASPTKVGQKTSSKQTKNVSKSKGRKASESKPAQLQAKQDEAPPVNQETTESVNRPPEKDDRKELMTKLKSIKAISEKLQDFVSTDRLQISAQKSDRLLALLNQVLATAEVTNKIVKLNTDEQIKINFAANLLGRAFKLSKKLDEVKLTQSKIKHGLDMQKLIETVSKFVNENKNKKVMPEKQKIMIQLVNLEQVNFLYDLLPSMSEVTEIESLLTKGRQVESELSELLEQKIVKPETITIKETIEIQVPVPVPVSVPQTKPEEKKDSLTISSQQSINEQTQEVHQAQIMVDHNEQDKSQNTEAALNSKEQKSELRPNSKDSRDSKQLSQLNQQVELGESQEKDGVADAIGGLQMVQEQIKESHQVLLTSKEATPQDQKMIRKVERLMSHMNEAINWLTQQREGSIPNIELTDSESVMNSTNKQIEIKQSDTATQEVLIREKEPNSKNTKIADAVEQSQTASNAPVTPQLAAQDAVDEINQIIVQENSFVKDDSSSLKKAIGKRSQSLNQKAKMKQVTKDAQLYLQEQDIGTVEEETVREADISRISKNQTSAQGANEKTKMQTYQLDRIGEEVKEQETQEAKILRDSQDREKQSDLDRALDEDKHDESINEVKINRSSRIEVFRKTPSALMTSNLSEDLKQASLINEDLTQQVATPRVTLNQQTSSQDLNTPLETRVTQDLESIAAQIEDQQVTTLVATKQSKSHSTANQNQINDFADAQSNLLAKANENSERMQLAEVMQMDQTQTFTSIKDKAEYKNQNHVNRINSTQNIKLANQNDKTVSNKDIAAHLRQSVAAETDYLKTASHFGMEPNKIDMKAMNIGIIKSGSSNPANETSNFLNALKNTVAVDQKRPVLNKLPADLQNMLKQQQQLQEEQQTKNKMMDTTPTLQLNNDLAETKQFLDSQASSIAEQDLEYGDASNTMKANNFTSKVKAEKTSQAKKTGPNPPYILPRNQQPSALKISKKPYNQQHIRVQEISGDLRIIERQEAFHRALVPENSVLMLTQETQTENRSLIKYLLTLINETIMKQLEEQSVRMSKQQFQESVNQISEAIPNLYEQIKDQSENFFVEEPEQQRMGPSYSTNNLKEAAESIGMQRDASKKDLINLIENQLAEIEPQQVLATNSGSRGGLAVGRSSLSPTVSVKAIHKVPSQRKLQEGESSTKRADPIQFLSIADFSRYGNHTLELSQEVKTRVNLKQVGALGGGFMGHRVEKTTPKY